MFARVADSTTQKAVDVFCRLRPIFLDIHAGHLKRCSLRIFVKFFQAEGSCRNVPFLLVMIGNLPAVMGLYIPYMFLPAVSTFPTCFCPR
jgi:hypothetical protein